MVVCGHRAITVNLTQSYTTGHCGLLLANLSENHGLMIVGSLKIKHVILLPIHNISVIGYFQALEAENNCTENKIASTRR